MSLRRPTPKPSPKSSITRIASPFPAIGARGQPPRLTDNIFTSVGAVNMPAKSTLVTAVVLGLPSTRISRTATRPSTPKSLTRRCARNLLDGLLYHESDLRIEEH